MSGQDTVWGGYILEKNHEKPTWNVTNAGSQLTWEGGRAGISKNVTDTKRDRRGVTTDLGGGQGRNKQKRYRHKT